MNKILGMPLSTPMVEVCSSHCSDGNKFRRVQLTVGSLCLKQIYDIKYSYDNLRLYSCMDSVLECKFSSIMVHNFLKRHRIKANPPRERAATPAHQQQQKQQQQQKATAKAEQQQH